jgi:hypothetical protein
MLLTCTKNMCGTRDRNELQDMGMHMLAGGKYE